MVLRLTEMTWPEVKRGLNSGIRTAVVMTASTEQHGPGLPLAVDAIRADELGERIADELGCFLAPTVRPGISEHHMDFPGTISLRPETFEAVVGDYCRSLARHGLEHLALITTHGGNTDNLEAAAERLDAELEANVFVAGTREGILETREEAMARHGVDADAAGAHAGAAETAFIMETHPELVDTEQLAAGYLGEVDEDALLREGFGAITENGVLGDQTEGTRAAGRTLIDEFTTYFADAVRDGRGE